MYNKKLKRTLKSAPLSLVLCCTNIALGAEIITKSTLWKRKNYIEVV